MKLTFRINYRTVWGESLCVLMEGNHGQAIPLSTRDGNEWQGTTEYMPEDDKAFVTYRYAVFRDSRCVRKELGALPCKSSNGQTGIFPL